MNISEEKYKEELELKQRYNTELAEFREMAYDADIHMPKRFCLVLTNLCNLACDFCYQIRTKQKNALDSEAWIKLIKELPENSRVSLTGGEPLILKNFKQVFTETANRHECNLICNGLLLTEEIIDLLLSFKSFKVLSISIDNRKNTIRKSANVKETKWDEKWSHAEKMMLYFQKRKIELGHPTCILDAKTVVLDENADDLLDIHKYCLDDLRCDTHSFQFLKGSPILGCDYMFKFEEIFEKSEAYKYKKWDTIKEQLCLVKKYNFQNKKVGFLHPKMDDLLENEEPLDDQKMDLLNEVEHKKENFKPCAQPWSSVHINVDGTVMPCLAVSMGNVQDNTMEEIVKGEEFCRFRKTIRDEGTVEACNRCGWLQPNI